MKLAALFLVLGLTLCLITRGVDGSLTGNPGPSEPGGQLIKFGPPGPPDLPTPGGPENKRKFCFTQNSAFSR